MPLPVKRRTVVAELAVTVSRYFEFALKVIYPPGYQRRSIRRKILFQNFYFIQFKIWPLSRLLPGAFLLIYKYNNVVSNPTKSQCQFSKLDAPISKNHISRCRQNN